MSWPVGAAPERTRLAWDRTTLSAAALANVLVKLGVTGSRPIELAAAGAIGLAALAMIVRSGWTARMRLAVVSALVSIAAVLILGQLVADAVTGQGS